MDGQLDPHFINSLEGKLKVNPFARVDSDVIDKLIVKDDRKEVSLTADEQSDLRAVFEGALTTSDHYWVSFEELGENASPVVITQSEFMRRMKDMAAMSPTSNLYSGMPDSRNLVVNVSHPLVKTIIEGKNKQLSDKLAELNEKIKPVKARVDELEKAQQNKKDEEIPQADKDALTEAEKQAKNDRESMLIVNSFALKVFFFHASRTYGR